MYIFLMGNFDEYIKFNLPTEFSRGRKDFKKEEYMSRIILNSPEDKASVEPSSVEFTWKGKVLSNYRLYLSTDPDFSGCEPIDVQKGELASYRGMSGTIVFFSLVLPGLDFRSRKKTIPFICLCFISVFLMNSCSTSIEHIPPEFQDLTMVVENLDPGTTYYWKLTACAKEPLSSDTIVRTFTTR